MADKFPTSSPGGAAHDPDEGCALSDRELRRERVREGIRRRYWTWQRPRPTGMHVHAPTGDRCLVCKRPRVCHERWRCVRHDNADHWFCMSCFRRGYR